MLPLIVFVPVIVSAVALFALLAGAAAGGVWEALEERQHAAPRAVASARPLIQMPGRSHARAA